MWRDAPRRLQNPTEELLGLRSGDNETAGGDVPVQLHAEQGVGLVVDALDVSIFLHAKRIHHFLEFFVAHMGELRVERAFLVKWAHGNSPFSAVWSLCTVVAIVTLCG
jgi:hypothetical protein